DMIRYIIGLDTGRPMLRRRALKLIGLGIAGGGAVLSWVRWRRPDPSLIGPTLPSSPVGPIDEQTRAIMMVVTETVLDGVSFDREHYARFFRWRAEHVPGYRQAYIDLATMADAAARRQFGARFSELMPDQRRQVLDEEFPSDSTHSKDSFGNIP